MNIVTLIKDEVQPYVSNIAVSVGDECLTYSELLSAVDSLAERIEALGAKKGDRIALLSYEGIEYIVLSLSLLSIGCVIVPIASSLCREEVESIIQKMRVRAFVYHPDLYDYTHTTHRDSQFLDFSSLRMHFFDVSVDNVYAECLDPAFLRFSSGTTGSSKGVLLSHQTIVERTDAANKGLQITSEDVIIWGMSMAYHFVVTILLFLRKAAHIVLCNENFPTSLVQGMLRNKGTVLYAAPFYYQMMASSDQFEESFFSSMRLAISTAMKLPAVIADDFYKAYAIEIAEAYGIIEVGLPFVHTACLSSKRGSVGKILPDYTVAIADPDEMGVGRILIKGPGLFDAYFTPFQVRDAVLKDGWFCSGDIGFVDEEGYLFILGREKSIINFNGMKIFPQEVEAVLNDHPQVLESLVYGVDHPRFGQIPCAHVVLKSTAGDFDDNDLRRYCYEHVAKYKVPKEILFVSQLEKTASGKLSR